MKWSWRLGKLAGIDVYVHATFVLFLAWIALSHWISGHGIVGMLSGTAFMLALFGSVLLHECGHAVTARRYGIRTRNIMLLPIGGIAQLERMPTEPMQELAVALAGPAVNAVIASLLFVILGAAGELAPIANLALTEGSLVERVMLANVSLMFFNLLPAFPMDGGRALRAFLKFWMPPLRATQVAAGVGQFFAFVFGFVGLMVNPMLVLIAIFIWFGAAQEASTELIKSSLSGVPVREAMLKDFRSLQEHETLSRAAYLMRTGSQHDFPVLRDGRITGILKQTDLMKALAAYGPDLHVAEAMQRDIHTVEATDPLEGVFIQLAQGQAKTVLVMEDGQLVGLLIPDSIAGFLMFQSALKQSGQNKHAKAA
jgi:Zn-dependent protease/predicted transcriptional regulator